MFNSIYPVTAAFVVKALSCLFLVLFVLSVTKKQAWKQRFWKQLGLSTLWLTLLCPCAFFTYDNYKEANEMISKTARTPDMVYALKYYVDSGVDVDLKDEDGMTPLMRSVYCDSVPNVHFLLSRGANPDVKNIHGQSARDIANERKKAEMMVLFR